jgi:hypothetical protein
VMIVAGLGLDEEAMRRGVPMGYRVHQWQASDAGVAGKSSAIGWPKRETQEQGKTWAAHAAQEVGNWGVFLPTLYKLYQVVTDTRRNPYADLSLEGKGRSAAYRFIR